MRRFLLTILATGFVAAPVFAGALTLQADDPTSIPEAVAKHAVVAAHTTACVSPEQTVVTAAAEGIVDGRRVTVPLKVIRLSQEGSYAVARDWPERGSWVVKMIATNPNYKNYATSIVVPVDAGASAVARAKSFRRAPTEADIEAALKADTLE